MSADVQNMQSEDYSSHSLHNKYLGECKAKVELYANRVQDRY